MANRLQHETSPYLLQHADNPVDWYPWGDEALARARAEDKPILLSIGYSACHWCHVMERESFQDARVAALMNERFVCVKVDREERPDLDAVYMQATLTLNRGHGGWPMNVFLTPDLEPFFAGTYFPPEDRFGMPSWTTILLALSERWASDRAELVRAGRTLADLLREGAAARHEGAVPPTRIDEAARELEAEFDPRHGGFGPAPKFPRAEALALLLRQHRRTGEARPLEMVVTTLEHMARGGIYDQLAGGFARYSTDARWLVPHFEKMLYDNALLARVYLAAWQLTGAPLLERVARETLDYLARDMTSPEGALYSATDADSEGEEGKFFVWTPAEVAAALEPEAARAFCAAYDVSEGGNWEGKSILWLPRPLGVVAAELGIPLFELEATLASARARLREARARRVPPALDDKVLTGWNALAIGAYADGWRALGERRYLTAATRAADFLLGRLVREDGGLYRSYRDGRARVAATLEDYAYLADALVDLFEASGRRRYLGAAMVLAERLVADFADPQGGFYLTARDEEAPLLRYREGHDGATPAPNAIAAQALARLAVHLDSSELRDVARRAVEAYGAQLARAPRGFCSTLAVVDLLERGPVELALVGRPGTPAFDALWREVHRHYLPNRALAFDPGEGVPSELEPLPLLADKQVPEGGAALFVCKDYACAAPITDPGAVARALGVR